MTSLTDLKKFLRSDAVKDDCAATLSYYIGQHSNEADHAAFVEFLESEYISNGKRKLGREDATKIGVYSLLDGMSTNNKTRVPTLNQLLDSKAYQDGNTSTYDAYLGERRTRNEEREFRQKLAFIADIFGLKVGEHQAYAVAEYMLGPMHESDSDSSEESSEEETDGYEDTEDEKSVGTDVEEDGDDARDIDLPTDDEVEVDVDDDVDAEADHHRSHDHHHDDTDNESEYLPSDDEREIESEDFSEDESDEEDRHHHGGRGRGRDKSSKSPPKSRSSRTSTKAKPKPKPKSKPKAKPKAKPARKTKANKSTKSRR
jgi:hypothetical protein